MLLLISAYKDEVQIAVLLVTAAVAIWRGAGPEKACAGVMAIVLWLGDILNHAIAASAARFTSVETGHLVLDVAGFALFLAIALFANRMYPLWMSITQGVVVLTHLAADAAKAAPLAYSILSIAPSYLLTALLIGGLIAHVRRVKRHGLYRSWRVATPPSPLAIHRR